MHEAGTETQMMSSQDAKVALGCKPLHLYDNILPNHDVSSYIDVIASSLTMVLTSSTVLVLFPLGPLWLVVVIYVMFQAILLLKAYCRISFHINTLLLLSIQNPESLFFTASSNLFPFVSIYAHRRLFFQT